MDLYELLDHVLALLQTRKRVSYRALQHRFTLDDETLEVLKAEILFAHPQVVDEEGHGLVWTGDVSASLVSSPTTPQQAPQSASPNTQPGPPDAARVPSP